MTITVFYSCAACAVVEAPVVVPARGDEDVVTWTQATAARCGAAHALRSPHCFATMLDLKVPLDPHADRIGGPPLH